MGTWRDLRSYGEVMTVLAGGVLAGAVSIYLAASVLPTAVGQIGGQDLYAWTMTVFLVGQVAAALLTASVLRAVGARTAYTAGFGLFAAGSVVCALAPAMPVMLGGRVLQGLGAGLLTGLGFAMIHATLPPPLWSRGSAVISAMFGLGNVLGPATGGALAQAGAWRWAFGALAAGAVLLGAGARRTLRRVPTPQATAGRVPWWSLVSVVAAASALGAAGLVDSPALAVALGVVAVVALAGFVVVDRRGPARVLPAAVHRRDSALRWVFLTIAVLAAAVAVETFLPLFGQRLAGLSPLVAGFYGAALSLGWAGVQVWSAGARGPAVVVAGPVVLAGGLAALALLTAGDAPVALAVGWLVTLVVAGAGIGLAMPHLTVYAMTLAGDESQRAAASVATVLTMATAVGSAVAGLLVALGQPDLVASARWLFAGFAVIALVGAVTARLLTARAGVSR
ncbi:MFS transporter [Actinophytocola xinjiangensis]|uniref:MFS transporter n=2 Tax=Actinophytocola xinjiangensis TaxID=485602 RepID=A0A7Z0WNS8_9PSEU|nr:MFS transporter [Actinophytocola xinjiangensis]